jgi:electron-transferring-flavoprotein dehydrogenase
VSPHRATDDIVPLNHQPRLRVDRLVLAEAPADDAIPLDVLFVGGGPAGLAGAIELARLCRDHPTDGDLRNVQIGVLEKAQTLGGHCLSGAVVNPRPFRELFPDLSDQDFPFRAPAERDRLYLLTARHALPLPTPAPMHNDGHYVASICEIVRWLGERAEELGVDILAGYPAAALLAEGNSVVGVRTAPAGLDRQGAPGPHYLPATDVTAKVTVLAEGTRGSLTQAYLSWQQISSPNPQIYALGVKELWRTPRVPDAIVHTMGWPLPRDAFGGSWLYPMGDDLVSAGLVVGLDYRQHSLDVHGLFQSLKLHPLFKRYLGGGEMVEWGARTIPEGGYFSLPERLSGAGVLIVGDAAGLVDVPSLKGIHYAMQSGIFAARTIFDALKRNRFTGETLRGYDQSLHDSFIYRDFYERRNMRLAFKSGLYIGGAKAALMAMTRGKFPGRRTTVPEDGAVSRTVTPAQRYTADGVYTFTKASAVYHAANTTRDDIPSHLQAGDDIDARLAEFYHHMCPAGVYEWQDGQLTVNAPNCIDCKATDILGPRWSVREGGSGAGYKRM